MSFFLGGGILLRHFFKIFLLVCVCVGWGGDSIVFLEEGDTIKEFFWNFYFTWWAGHCCAFLEGDTIKTNLPVVQSLALGFHV